MLRTRYRFTAQESAGGEHRPNPNLASRLLRQAMKWELMLPSHITGHRHSSLSIQVQPLCNEGSCFLERMLPMSHAKEGKKNAAERILMCLPGCIK